MAGNTERFAPSPTGSLHLGHAFSALTAFNNAKRTNGKFKLRLDNIDIERCRSEYEKKICSDLKWLGISWDGPIMRQSDRLRKYKLAVNKLVGKGLVYGCSCTRREIENSLIAPHNFSASKNKIYPGLCREKKNGILGLNLRLDLSKSLQVLEDEEIAFFEIGIGPQGQSGKQVLDKDKASKEIGDIIIARKDIGTSYNLSTVVDDMEEGITNVTRGNDLFPITFIQVIIQKLLGYKTPIYFHHKLLTDSTGNRLAKRKGSKTIASYRANGFTAEEIKKIIFSKQI